MELQSFERVFVVGAFGVWNVENLSPLGARLLVTRVDTPRVTCVGTPLTTWWPCVHMGCRIQSCYGAAPALNNRIPRATPTMKARKNRGPAELLCTDNVFSYHRTVPPLPKPR
jgi:hypothetical protein